MADIAYLSRNKQLLGKSSNPEFLKWQHSLVSLGRGWGVNF